MVKDISVTTVSTVGEVEDSDSFKILELAKKHDIKLNFNTRKFYDKYGYTIDISNNQDNEYIPTRITIPIYRQNFRRTCQVLRQKQKQVDRILKHFELFEEAVNYVNKLTKGEYSRRDLMDGQIRFYLKDPEVVLKILKKYKKHVAAVSSPVVGDREGEFKRNRNFINRKQLYYKKYRYRLLFEGSRDFLDNGWKDLQWRIGNLNEDEYMLSDGDYVENAYQYLIKNKRSFSGRFWGTARAKLYLKDEEQFVFLKMVFQNYLVNAFEVVLNDEIMKEEDEEDDNGTEDQ